ncbi:hypothetical protein BACT_0505 [Bifidobacterium actinocoloniiforme DSM 22766]|uniref:Uncharacterized protein n=1 Tax=Bifidobacterium actinocoloniiforme DSM 22766 TaxID=1437605 RepID=A0A086YZV5_9BIFI|nr:hypothetical protein BACT_0505 [Bifidobacterium actinocoloniiforme DSM 22766]
MDDIWQAVTALGTFLGGLAALISAIKSDGKRCRRRK